MRWAGHVVCMGEMSNLKRQAHVGDIGVDGRIMLKCIFLKYMI
jgi:hypothetical protein